MLRASISSSSLTAQQSCMFYMGLVENNGSTSTSQFLHHDCDIILTSQLICHSDDHWCVSLLLVAVVVLLLLTSFQEGIKLVHQMELANGQKGH